MATYVAIQAKVAKGYATAAGVLGQPHQHFRPADPLAPLAAPLGTLAAFFATEPDLKLRKPSTYKDPASYGAFDTAQTLPGDYLVGPDGTRFIASQEPLLPPLCIECNRVLSFMRAPSDLPADPAQDQGAEGYGGRPLSAPPDPSPGNDTPLMTGWPASVLLGTKGENAPASGRLPDDTRSPWWSIKLPAFLGVALANTDRITDDLGRIYAVSAAELTERGWNITAVQEVV